MEKRWNNFKNAILVNESSFLNCDRGTYTIQPLRLT